MKDNIQFVQAKKALQNINREKIRKTILATIAKHKYKLQDITYVFVSDDELLEINKAHLNHDYYTDIITFDLSEVKKMISSEIYISIDRVRDNAIKMKTSIKNEMLRVMFHGVLHLCGYKDKTQSEEKLMRKLEDECLTLYSQIK